MSENRGRWAGSWCQHSLMMWNNSGGQFAGRVNVFSVSSPPEADVLPMPEADEVVLPLQPDELSEASGVW